MNSKVITSRRAYSKVIDVVDLYCGGGGTSTGIVEACEEAGIGINLTAINHWPVAVATHTKNHPWATHLCESLDNLDPRKVVPGGHLHALVASPPCTHHSNARGGVPMSDQSRASAWQVVHWAEALRIDNILMENVKEWEFWGPLGANGRPLKSRRGETFQAMLRAFESLNYNVEYRKIVCANHGDPTTRERLFVMMRKRPRKIEWPEPSHGKPGAQASLFESLQPWRTAREIIDWSLTGTSIFNRKKPLAPTTIARIAAGLKRFGGANAEPFLIMLYGTGKTRTVDAPLPTVTAGGGHIGLCEPFLRSMEHGGSNRSLDRPMPTITTADAFGVVQPFLIGAGGPTGSGRQPKSVNQPLGTVMTENHTALIEPFIVELRKKSTFRAIDEPLSTVTCKGAHHALVEPFVVQMNHAGDVPRSVSEPMVTVTATSADFGLVEPFIVPLNHGSGDTRSHSLADPMPTVTTVDAWSIIEPFIVKFYGSGGEQDLNQPLATITAKDRFGVVQTYGLDIRFRMLQPHELASAMSFPEGYEFTGNRELKVKQIGNAVPVKTAKALGLSLLSEYAQKKAAA